MKNRRSVTFLALLTAIAVTSLVVVSCNKKFDEPPSYIGPNITPTMTINELKALHTTGGLEQITADEIIGGIVVADDLSGNFYKTIDIQDETGGIQLKLDGYDLYTQYPVGRQVYVNVKGLFLGDYNKLIQLGGGIDATVTPARLGYLATGLFDQYITKGSLNNPVTPKVVKVADLNDSYQSMLIQLDNFEFAAADTSKTFADVSLTASALNYTIKSCASESIVLRNSSYADFAGYGLPNGNGSILAIYTVFGSTKQLNIRDSSDVKFYNSRCGGSGGGGGTGSIIDLADLRNLYTGSDVVLGSYLVNGIVISDAASKNVGAGNIILQNGNKGIALYFGSSAATGNFLIGDSILVDVTGGTLKSYNGSLEIVLSSSALPNVKLGTGMNVTPRVLTIDEINTQLPDIEYTLVKIVGATASGNATYGGNNTLTDATGSMTLYTKSGTSAATFAGNALPAGSNTWTGYCNVFSTTKEFQIRNTSDVVADGGGGGGGGTGTSDLLFSEYVEGSSNNKYIEIYNAGSAAADLTKYVVKLYVNGQTTVSSTATLDVVSGSASLAAGGVIVLKNSGAALTLPAGVTAFSSGVCGFNGNDALTLEKDGTVIDVLGLVGNDPTTGWVVSTIADATKDHTIRRKASVTAGNTDWNTSSSNEWDVIAIDDVSNLGTR
ncbi:MAG TPA: DUF5689 domain-containing protein [Panacibacter sp.]|nr:DUF5689 domain-containing protein [Panacibacter sp.]